LGAGAIGSIVGAALAERHEVILVGRQAHVRAINASGLRITGNERRLVRLAARTELDPERPGEVVLVAVKACALAAALQEAAALVPPDACVALLLNGLGVEEVAHQALPSHEIVRLVVSIGAAFREPGVVEHWDGPALEGWAGPGLEAPEGRAGRRVAELFDGTSIQVRVRSDFDQVVWRKLAVNCIVNPLSALLGLRNCDVIDPRTRQLRRAVYDEVAAVAATEGVTLAEEFFDKVEERIQVSKNYSSMLQDIEQGRSTEIEFLNGAVAARGAANGIPTPVNDTLAILIRGLQKKGQ